MRNMTAEESQAIQHLAKQDSFQIYLAYLDSCYEKAKETLVTETVNIELVRGEAIGLQVLTRTIHESINKEPIELIPVGSLQHIQETIPPGYGHLD